jgi:hypothetical protein
MWSNGHMRTAALVAALVVLPLVAAAEVDLKSANGRLDLKVTAAPLSEVLDRLAKQTGMKVTYEGAPVRQPVTLTLLGRTPAEAVLGVLDGLGLNYALRMDMSGTRVEALLIAGTAAVTSGSPTLPSMPNTAPALRPPATPAPEPDEEPEAEETEPPEPPRKPGAPPQPGQPPNPNPAAGTGPVGVPKPNMPTFPGPGVPTAGPMFPVSPFAPTAPTMPPPSQGNQPTPEQQAAAQPVAGASDDESQ